MMAKPADKMVQSGNSRVKVTIYGQVNRAVRFASSGGKSDIHSVDNSESNSRIGFRAVAALNKSTTAVALSEWAMAADGGRSTGFSDDGTAQGNAGNVSIRHSIVDLVNKDMGTLSLGHSTRADASAIFTGFNGTTIVFHGGGPGNIDGKLSPANDDDLMLDGARIGVPTNVYPGRENRLLYRTPNLMGISMAASLNQSKSWFVGGSFKSPASMSKDISVAVGFGYRAQPNASAGKTNTLGVSGGVQHNPSGLSVNGVYAQEQISGGDRHSGWAADLSWTGKLMDAGSTSLTIGYGQYKDGDYKQTKGYWLALNQRVNSAAADLYLGVSYDTGKGAYTVMHPTDDEGAIISGLDFDGTTTADNAEDDADTVCGAVADADAATASQDSMCSIKRENVMVILAGVRVKF